MAVDAEEQRKLDDLIAFVARKGEISEASARRLVTQIFFKSKPRDRYLHTEIGEVTLGIMLLDNPEMYGWLMRGEPYEFLPGKDQKGRFGWIVRVPVPLAPVVIQCWDHFVRATYDRSRCLEAVNAGNVGNAKPEISDRRQYWLQAKLQEADARLEMTREVWDRERRKYWPMAMAIVNNRAREIG
ncbi:hypothetical protein HFQ13_10780 [Acidithiobacillus sp. VAN18-1]|uniref:Uncharacterized protein n=1 Tax=Igneacidithiobacillus copahuensis TaxID=2724909 RepID=A0AAE3CKD2_9PROT|nr:hypothetical protein [Igneacidithiobacillus copahuensis]MBU2788676.1 hypothetical protein [Igneacidithiobacillus copahuensis]MBU2796640.1 hypothetical protein [Acidithiobacillus sp. VAN18-2]